MCASIDDAFLRKSSKKKARVVLKTDVIVCIACAGSPVGICFLDGRVEVDWPAPMHGTRTVYTRSIQLAVLLCRMPTSVVATCQFVLFIFSGRVLGARARPVLSVVSADPGSYTCEGE